MDALPSTPSSYHLYARRAAGSQRAALASAAAAVLAASAAQFPDQTGDQQARSNLGANFSAAA